MWEFCGFKHTHIGIYIKSDTLIQACPAECLAYTEAWMNLARIMFKILFGGKGREGGRVGTLYFEHRFQARCGWVAGWLVRCVSGSSLSLSWSKRWKKPADPIWLTGAFSAHLACCSMLRLKRVYLGSLDSADYSTPHNCFCLFFFFFKGKD